VYVDVGVDLDSELPNVNLEVNLEAEVVPERSKHTVEIATYRHKKSYYELLLPGVAATLLSLNSGIILKISLTREVTITTN
jgi:hypothetical protein